MPTYSHPIEINGLIGVCGSRKVFIGFAPASLLHKTSFADVSNEDTGSGYQRPINSAHSMEFRRYIQTSGATTISLTLNLRKELQSAWKLNVQSDGRATLTIDSSVRVFAQVDCQHRLGFLSGIDLPLAFMSFVNLDVDEEREIFTTINSKAKGLSGSLIDANAAKLAKDLGAEAPALYIATRLSDDADSPWCGRLRRGGLSLGLKKPVSLRMMKNASERYLRELKNQRLFTVDMAADSTKQFWKAVTIVYAQAWDQPRNHYITKGVGIYSLMSLAGQLTRDALQKGHSTSEAYFAGILSDRLGDFDWRHGGPLESFNGEKGADQALRHLSMHMSLAMDKGVKPKWPTKTSS